MKTLDGGRIGIASQALGLGEGAVEEAIKYTKAVSYTHLDVYKRQPSSSPSGISTAICSPDSFAHNDKAQGALPCSAPWAC